MALGSANRNRGFWFGTEQRMDWFPTPNRGADMSPQDWNSEGTLLNGGAYNFASFGSHKTYTFEWPNTSAREVAQLMKSYADGTYGRGLIYFQDCLMFDTNVLPAQVADPSMAIGYEGNSLVYGVQPKAVPSLSGPNNLPVTSAQYDLTSARVGFNKGAGAVFVPIPEGYTLAFGAVYSVDALDPSNSGVFLTYQDRLGNVGTTVRAEPLSGSGDLVNTLVRSSSAVAGVWVWVGRQTSTFSFVTLQAMTARLIRTDLANETVIATNYIPSIRGSGTWAEVRRNMHPNPDPSSSLTTLGYAINSGEGTMVQNPDGSIRWTSASTTIAVRFAADSMSSVQGETYRMQMRVRANKSMRIRLRMRVGVSNIITIGTAWTWVDADVVAGSGASDLWSGILALTADVVAGDWIEVAQTCVEHNPIVRGSWFSGAGEGQGITGTTRDPDFRARWLGAPNESESVLEGELVADITSSLTIPVLSTAEGVPAVRVIPKRDAATGGYRAYYPVPSGARDAGVLIATRHLDSAPTGGETFARTLAAGDPLRGTGAPQQAGATPLRHTWGGSSSNPALTSAFRAYLYGDGPLRPGGQDVRWTSVGLFSGDYDGPWFDGDSTDPTGEFGYRWVGAPGASASEKYRINRDLERVRKGPWIGGQGHSGCRFSGKPTYIANGPANGGQIGFAASFTEVGSWVNG